MRLQLKFETTTLTNQGGLHTTPPPTHPLHVINGQRGRTVLIHRSKYLAEMILLNPACFDRKWSPSFISFICYGDEWKLCIRYCLFDNISYGYVSTTWYIIKRVWPGSSTCREDQIWNMKRLNLLMLNWTFGRWSHKAVNLWLWVLLFWCHTLRNLVNANTCATNKR